MKNLKLKEIILKETEQLKTKEKNRKIIFLICWGIVIMGSVILALYLGRLCSRYLFFFSEDPGLNSFEHFLFVLMGVAIGIFINLTATKWIFNYEAIEERADKKAKEISIARILPILMQAFAKINNNEDLSKNLEEKLKEIMDKNDITWYDSDGELQHDWGFSIDPFKFQIDKKNAYLFEIAIDENLSTSEKIVVEMACLVEIDTKDNVNTFSDRRVYVTME